MMPKLELLQKLAKTSISNAESRKNLGAIIRKEFDQTSNQNRAFELLQLAWKYQIPELDEMLNDYSIDESDWL